MDLIVQRLQRIDERDGIEEAETIRCGYSVADVSAGMFAIMGILMALRSRSAADAGSTSTFRCSTA